MRWTVALFDAFCVAGLVVTGYGAGQTPNPWPVLVVLGGPSLMFGAVAWIGWYTERERRRARRQPSTVVPTR